MEGYKNTALSFRERAADLVSRMTLEEKVYQLGNVSAAIPRLEIPAYNYWSEASHGITGIFKEAKEDVTIFPVCLAMSNTWDRDRIEEVTKVISDEIRAYHNLVGDELHYWCPNINLTRDPRWGRNDESFGEDAFLAGKLAARYVQGLQGHDEKYLKAVSTPKHYALNNSERDRHTGSSDVDESILREYYCKVFEYAIREGFAQSIMTSYNRINGIPASANKKLLQTLLREEWGFDGFVVSDCGAVADVYANGMMHGGMGGHKYAKSMEEASAMSLEAGTDMSCGREHKIGLLNAVEQGMITEDVVDRALIHIFAVRFRLGLFEEQEPFAELGENDTSENPEHQALAEKLAEESIVLLKNENNTLPLSADKTKKILVLGPNAIIRQLGGYSAGENGMIDSTVNILPLEGIREAAEKRGIEVEYAKGWNKSKKGGFYDHDDEDGAAVLPGMETIDPEKLDEMETGDLPGMEAANMDFLPFIKSAIASKQFKKRYPVMDAEEGQTDEELWTTALKKAADVDAIVVIAGTDGSVASEESDRNNTILPYGQDEKIQELFAINPNTIVVCQTLGPMTGEFFGKVPAVLSAIYGGQAQGRGIANVLFGDFNPSGHLTQTWYLSDEDLPRISQYGLRKQDTDNRKGRTYMYFTDPVLFPFGHGLSYTTFAYNNFALDKSEYDANDTVRMTVDVTNTGSMAGGDVVQLYVKKHIPAGAVDNKPEKQLKGFAKVFLEPGETKTVTIDVPWKEITFWQNRLECYVVEPGTYSFWLGNSAADEEILCQAEVAVSGKWNAPLATVMAEAEKYVFAVGQQARVLATATKEDAEHLCLFCNPPTFTSGDEAVVTVDERGMITAVAAGVTEITVSLTVDGVTKSAVVPVVVK